MGKRRHGQRRRESRDRKVMVEATWFFESMPAVIVRILRNGMCDVTIPDAARVGSVGREIAADWIKEYIPRLSHDDRYELLWGGV